MKEPAIVRLEAGDHEPSPAAPADPVASFTVNIPDPAVVAALRRAGTVVIQTVTSAEEARAAREAGVDA